MESVSDGMVGQRIVFFGQRYFLRGTLDATFLDDMGVLWFEMGADTTQWENCNEKGPTKEFPFGRVRLPQTAVGLGIQLEKDKGWRAPK